MRQARQRHWWWCSIVTLAVVTVLVALSGCESADVLGADVTSATDTESGSDTEDDPGPYTVTYDANGATDGTAPWEQTKTHGEDLTLADNDGNLQRRGDSFTGWNTEADGTGTDYDSGAIYTTDADLTLYAKWTPVHQIGDLRLFGIVFYDKGEYTDDWRYLEVAHVSTEWTGIVWGGFGTEVGPSAQGTSIGTGRANTEAILAELGDGGYAARRCADLSLSLLLPGFSPVDDWFLPSKEELNLIYENLHLEGLGDFTDAGYWSSSELDSDMAYFQYFGDGFQFPLDKSMEYRVRAVRAF